MEGNSSQENLMDILAAIDGTMSHGDATWTHLPFGIGRPLLDKPGGDATNSHVYDFYRRFSTLGGWKEYFEGPAIVGEDVGRIKREVLFYLKREAQMPYYPWRDRWNSSHGKDISRSTRPYVG